MDGHDDGSLSQRIRIGLTGLACVFLLVLLAASIFGLVGRNPPAASGPTASAFANTTGNVQDAPRDPLAELGVAPGNAPDHSVGNATAATAPARSLSLAPRQSAPAAKPPR